MWKLIDTHGIFHLEPLEGDGSWYWGSDCTHGDLYEAGELYQDHHALHGSRLVLVHDPDGRVIEPVAPKPGRFFGRPISCGGHIQILLVDFPESQIRILQYEEAADLAVPVVSLPLTAVTDCYNLMLHASPLTLSRQESGGTIQILWPERAEFDIGETEHFFARRGDKLYFCRWHEDPEYREEVVVRAFPSGEETEVIPGAWMKMPDGRVWILQ